MIYKNLTNEELLKEVYLTQHEDRLLTLVCERLEMEMRELAENVGEIDRLNEQLADQDKEIFKPNKKVDDLEARINFLTEDDPEF